MAGETMSDAAPPAEPKAAATDAPHAAKHQPAHRHGAEVAHATHGRVRLKIPAAKRNPDLLNQIKAAFETLPGIDSIEVRQESGSLVICYDPDHHQDIASLFVSLSQAQAAPVAVDHPAVAPAAHRPPPTKVDDLTSSIEAEAEYLAEHSHIARSVVEAVKQLDRQLKRSSNNNLDLKIMVPIALAAVTFLEIGAAAATPMWVTLAIFSMNHFVELHAHDADKDGPV
jgi:hypothetical protein